MKLGYYLTSLLSPKFSWIGNKRLIKQELGMKGYRKLKFLSLPWIVNLTADALIAEIIGLGRSSWSLAVQIPGSKRLSARFRLRTFLFGPARTCFSRSRFPLASLSRLQLGTESDTLFPVCPTRWGSAWRGARCPWLCELVVRLLEGLEGLRWVNHRRKRCSCRSPHGRTASHGSCMWRARR